MTNMSILKCPMLQPQPVSTGDALKVESAGDILRLSGELLACAEGKDLTETRT